VHHLCIDFKKAHLVAMEILYNKLPESDITLKRLIKMCLNETYS